MLAQWFFIALYACSGAAGLLYEIVWTRLLALHLGHTVAAAGTVLAAFMGGLAAGAFTAGRLAAGLDRQRALRAYAAVELVVGACAIVVPYALRAWEPALQAAYGAAPTLTFGLVRFASSLVVVFIPACVIGATLPFAIRWFVRNPSTAGRDAGGLYAANTVGAAVGSLLTGFLLIPALGLRTTTWVGVGLNAAVAIGAWLLASKPLDLGSQMVTQKRAGATSRRARAPGQGHTTRSSAAHAPTAAPPGWLPAVALGLSGFVALVYEVTFTRVLGIALGPTTYAFAAMVSAFIGGLAMGATIGSSMTWSRPRAVLWTGWVLVATAAAAAWAGWFAGSHLPMLVAEAVAEPSAGASQILLREALYGVGLLLPLSIALGLLFPLGIALTVNGSETAPRSVSTLYAVNTFGGVAGSLVGAFVLVPWLGLQLTLRIASACALGAASVAFVFGRLSPWRQWTGLAAALVGVVLVFAVPGWDVSLLSSGVYKYASDVRGLNLDLETGLKAGRLLYYKEGASSTVSVRTLAGTRALAIDGKVDASNRTDMLTQKLLAHVPLLLHREPRRVAIVGLGSGVTLGAALRHPVERVDVIEISPEVVEASAFFSEDNGRGLEDRRTRLIVSDGRSHVQLTSSRYDVIISEPSNPWMAGIAPLFTREFFLSARSRLAPGGVMCQWAHTYDIADADLRSIAATFASVFPQGSIWLVGEGDVLFVATNDAAGLALDRIEAAWRRPGVAEDLATVSVLDPFSLLSLYVGGARQLEQYGRSHAIQTDDRTRIEFSGPLGIYDRRGSANAPLLAALMAASEVPAVIQAATTAAGAVEWAHRGLMLLNARADAGAYESLARSVQLDPTVEATLTGFVDAASGSPDRLGNARRLLEAVVSRRPDALPVRAALARLLAASGDVDSAVSQAQAVVAAQPSSAGGIELLASILADAGDLARLQPLVAQMRQRFPERDETLYYEALSSFLAGRPQEAIARAERLVRTNTRHVLAQNLIGSASAQLGLRDRARAAFMASLAANPRESSTYANLGRLELEGGDPEAAIGYLGEALTLDPNDEQARANLASALAARR